MRGWLPLLDVCVGDFVLTHLGHWKRVKSVLVKPSGASHRLAKVGGVSCTSNHLWYTSNGWESVDSLNEQSDYSVGQMEDSETVFQSLGKYLPGFELIPLRIEQEGLCLRGMQEFAGVLVPEVLEQAEETPLIREFAEVADVLLGDILPRGTAVYDIEVEDDHSFCIEGLFAHNTNDRCSLSFMNESGEEWLG
jgi:hypothetical protein